MVTNLLLDGTNTLAQNTVYAIPAKAKWVKAVDALEVTLGTTGGIFVAVTATTTGVVLVGQFVRCTSATTTLTMVNT